MNPIDIDGKLAYFVRMFMKRRLHRGRMDTERSMNWFINRHLSHQLASNMILVSNLMDSKLNEDIPDEYEFYRCYMPEDQGIDQKEFWMNLMFHFRDYMYE